MALPSTISPNTALAELSNIRAMDTLIGLYHGRLEMVPGDFRKRAIDGSRAPTAEEREAMEGRRSDLRARLSPGGTSCAPALARLMEAFPSYGGDARAAAASLKSALEVIGKLPAWAVSEAVARFRQNTATTKWDAGKAPTEPQIVAEVRTITEPLETEMVRLNEILGAEVYKPMSEAQRAKLDAAVKAWADERAMMRVGDAKRETADDLDARLRRTGSLDGLKLSGTALTDTAARAARRQSEEKVA